MKYIVFDLEFNQPFDFKTGTQTILNPDCPFEIIQIGAVKLDEQFHIEDSFNYLIKPKIYPRIHPYVEKITGITRAMLENCPGFEEAYEAFEEFVGDEESILCTWGKDDLKSLYRNILFYNLETKWLPDRYINIQRYATEYLKYDAGKSIGLKNAVELLHIEVEEAFHDALNDAVYTGKIFKVVKPENIVPELYTAKDLLKKREPRMRLDTKSLMKHFSEMLGREISDDEAKVIKAAYKLGRNKTFDVSKEKYIKLLKGEKK